MIREIRAWWSGRRSDIAAVSVIVLFYLVLALLGIGCPIRFMTGVSCPGCGMTRAWWYALQGMFQKAWHYHPLFPVPPFVLMLYLFRERIPVRTYCAAVILTAFLFFAVWLSRLFFGDGTVVRFAPWDNGFFRLFRLLIRVFTDDFAGAMM